MEATGKKPGWSKKLDTFGKKILSFKSRRAAPKLLGDPMKGPFADLGLICLPSGLRSHVTDTEVHPWNVWDDSIPKNFFMFMDRFLPNTGFLAVLHSEEYDHTRKVRDAVDSTERFKHCSSFQVLLPTLMFKANMDVQVQILTLNIFCRLGCDAKLSKDSEFVLVFSGEDLQTTSLITLSLSKERNHAFEDAFHAAAESAMHSASLPHGVIIEMPPPKLQAIAGPSGSKDPEKKKLFKYFNDPSDDEGKDEMPRRQHEEE
ncbi:unnamed protein product [Calypogeia fissa]